MLITRERAAADRFLVEDHPLSYLASASMLDAVRSTTVSSHRRGRLPLLAFARPDYGDRFTDLEDTQQEADEIAAILGASSDDALITGRSASKRVLLRMNKKGGLTRYRYLLFATHGVLPNEVSELEQPALVLAFPRSSSKASRDKAGFLTMADILSLRLDADLVSLTACNSAMGERIRGEGMMGLTRAFMFAGAEVVAATLWSVDSLSTKQLSVAFFRHLRRTGDAVRALQLAKIGMLRGEFGDQYRRPDYWAPLILFGRPG